MQKEYLTPKQMVDIASQHAKCAEYLLAENAEIRNHDGLSTEALNAIASLMYTAFDLVLKACLLYEYRKINQYKKLQELIEANRHLDFSKNDIELISVLSRHMAFCKGIDYSLWESREEQFIFLKKINKLFQRLQKQLPLELSDFYHKS